MLVIITNISSWASNSSSGEWNKDKFSRCRAVYWWIQGHKYQSDLLGSLGCGCKLDGNTKKVTITLNGKKVVLQIGIKTMK